jgi:hypothetical protein
MTGPITKLAAMTLRQQELLFASEPAPKHGNRANAEKHRTGHKREQDGDIDARSHWNSPSD